jgi:hypothetical protein
VLVGAPAGVPQPGRLGRVELQAEAAGNLQLHVGGGSVPRGRRSRVAGRKPGWPPNPGQPRRACAGPAGYRCSPRQSAREDRRGNSPLRATRPAMAAPGLPGAAARSATDPGDCRAARACRQGGRAPADCRARRGTPGRQPGRQPPADGPLRRVRRAGRRYKRRGGRDVRAEARWRIVASLDEHPVRTIRTLF